MDHTLTSARKTFALTHQKIMETARAIGHFMYGDDKRTKFSIAFAYICLSVYLIAVINAQSMNACVGG